MKKRNPLTPKPETSNTPYRQLMPISQRMYPILGLNILRLLAQGHIAEFHTTLEQLTTEELSNQYINYPIQVEHSLMEGSHNKIAAARKDVPANEYQFFMDILTEMIR